MRATAIAVPNSSNCYYCYYYIYFINIDVHSFRFFERQESMIIVDLNAMRFVMRRNITATAGWFPAQHKKKEFDAINWIWIEFNIELMLVQASFHAYGLRMFGHIDDVLPDAAAGLSQLRSSVFDFGRAEESTFFGEITMSVIVFTLSPVSSINQSKMTRDRYSTQTLCNDYAQIYRLP